MIGAMTSQLLAEDRMKAESWMCILIRSLTLLLLAEDRMKAESWMCILIRSLTLLLLGEYSRVFYKGSVERNNYSRSRLGNSISRPPQKLELVKIVDKLLAHVGNGGTELKAYKKSRITHPGKHGHNVGSTAFRNWAQGGDGSGEELTIQDDWGSSDTTVNSSVQMTSPPPKTTPQTPPTPPPPQTPRATPQVQPPTPTPTPQVQPPTPTPQVQPPTPTPQVQPRTPTPAPPPPPPPPPRGWFNFNFGGWFNFNVAGLAKIFLTISATLVLAPPQIVLSGGNSLSPNDKTLLFGTKLLGLGGFIFCLLAYIVGQDNTAAKLLIALGVLANVFGLLLLVALGK
ncbi:formin-like protein 14 [Citrus clementina]|uniref:formin-like protein 14 n=1 Tax=Citrus clementina TaxID=85681 RepID=UPI000CED62DB|nr:formin-like protein 14 [Citrus x clementina]XP_024044565.1 formin-like protein 14 [Citrus x clementina]